MQIFPLSRYFLLFILSLALFQIVDFLIDFHLWDLMDCPYYLLRRNPRCYLLTASIRATLTIDCDWIEWKFNLVHISLCVYCCAAAHNTNKTRLGSLDCVPNIYSTQILAINALDQFAHRPPPPPTSTDDIRLQLYYPYNLIFSFLVLNNTALLVSKCECSQNFII